MHLVNREGRHEVEADACRRIVAYCREAYRDFETSELTLDFSRLPGIPADMLCVCFAAGQLAGQRPDIVRLLIGVCREEGQWWQRWHHIVRMIEGAAWPRPAPELLLPFLEQTKAEEIACLPPALRPLVWSCRRPVRAAAGFEPCGACKACRFRGMAPAAGTGR